MIPFEYLVAECTDAALSEYAKEGVSLKAGGIDLLDLMKEHINTPKVVLSIDGISELRYIRQEPDGVHIGSGATLPWVTSRRVCARANDGSSSPAAAPPIRASRRLNGKAGRRNGVTDIRGLTSKKIGQNISHETSRVDRR